MVFFYDPSDPYGGVRSGANPDEYVIRQGSGIRGYGVDPERRARVMKRLRAGKGIMGYGIDPDRRARIMQRLRQRRGMGIMGYGWPGVKLSYLKTLLGKKLSKDSPESKVVYVKVRDKKDPTKWEKIPGTNLNKKVPVRAHEVKAKVNGEERVYYITKDAIEKTIKGLKTAKETREKNKIEFDKKDKKLRDDYFIDRLKGINSKFAKRQRALYRQAKADLREEEAMKRVKAGKAHPWALAKYDPETNEKIKDLPGMTPGRFRKIKKYLNNPNITVEKFKKRMNRRSRTSEDFFNKWIDFDNPKVIEKNIPYTKEEAKIRDAIQVLYTAVNRGWTPGQKRREAFNIYLDKISRGVANNEDEAKNLLRNRKALQTYRKLRMQPSLPTYQAAMYANRMQGYEDPFKGFEGFKDRLSQTEIDKAIEIVDALVERKLNPDLIEKAAKDIIEGRLDISSKGAQDLVNAILKETPAAKVNLYDNLNRVDDDDIGEDERRVDGFDYSDFLPPPKKDDNNIDLDNQLIVDDPYNVDDFKPINNNDMILDNEPVEEYSNVVKPF